MAFEVSLLQEEDIPEFVEVDDVAMQGYSWAQAMAHDLPKDVPRKKLIERYMKEGFRQDESYVWLKANDTSSGRLIASALWQFDFEGSQPEATPEDDAILGEVRRPLTFRDVSERRGKAFKSKFIGSRPNAYLSILFTHPDHRKKGVGTKLVEWGCQKADERGMLCYLHASPEGLKLYLKNGFEIVHEEERDLRPWRIEETILQRSLIRPAR